MQLIHQIVATDQSVSLEDTLTSLKSLKTSPAITPPENYIPSVVGDVYVWSVGERRELEQSGDMVVVNCPRPQFYFRTEEIRLNYLYDSLP